MTINHTDKLFGTLQVKRLATLNDLCRYKQKTERGRLTVGNILNKKQRHKYWYCQCTACSKIHIVSSNYLSRKVCKCK